MMTRWGDGMGEPPPLAPRGQDPAYQPSPQEVDWLRELSFNSTVAKLAVRTGCSEQTMFRRLQDLYDRLQVRDCDDALQLARKEGWL